MASRTSTRVHAAATVVLLVGIALAGCTQLSNDPDQDGLPTSLEDSIGTDPNNPDTDGDGLNDREETQGPPEGYAHLGVDPLNADTDGDGLNDFEEAVKWGTDPASGDGDRDGLADPDEIDIGDWSCGDETVEPPRCQLLAGPDPTVADTDGDHWQDGPEHSYWSQRGLDRIDIQDYLRTADVDEDGWADGRDGEPLFDISIEVELVKINLTRSFDGGPANVTARIDLAGRTRTVHIDKEVPEGLVWLNTSRRFDVDDGPRPPGELKVSSALTLRHVDDSGEATAIRLDGNRSSIIPPAFDAGDHREPTYRSRSNGTDGSLTYRLKACRGGC